MFRNRFFRSLGLSLIALIPIASGASRAAAQTPIRTPSETLIQFYKLMHERHYREALAMSIYRSAIDGLNQQDFEDLQSDFDKMAADIPDKIEITGEQITGNIATVMVKIPNDDPAKVTIEPATLFRSGDAWIVGDEASEAVVKKGGKKFFLDARIDTHQGVVEELLKRLLTVEVLYSSQHSGSFGDLPALIRAGLMPQDLTGTESTGYRFQLTVAKDGKSYTAGAQPASYGRSGKLSYWMDQTGTIKSADNKGQPLVPK
jgi:hypothetical protein